MLYLFVINLIISGIFCQNIERIVVTQGRSFSFNCQQDESVFYAKQLNDNQWLEIRERNEYYLHLNLNFQYLTHDNVLRVITDSAESKHVGYYACQKPTWATAMKNTIYQVILAGIKSFYWNYICHGPIGSCERVDDVVDENLSTLEVADQTNIELFCCGYVTGYSTVNIYMNRIGDSLGGVEINKKQENDGAWVVCANQRTVLRRISASNQQILTCELKTDNQPNSMLSSIITIKDPILPDPSWNYNPYSEGNRNDDYFKGQTLSEIRSRRRMSTGKKLAIILGSVLGGLVLLGLSIFFTLTLCRNKVASSNSKTDNLKQYTSVRTTEQPRYNLHRSPQDEESAYEEPIPCPATVPIIVRS